MEGRDFLGKNVHLLPSEWLTESSLWTEEILTRECCCKEGHVWKMERGISNILRHLPPLDIIFASLSSRACFIFLTDLSGHQRHERLVPIRTDGLRKHFELDVNQKGNLTDGASPGNQPSDYWNQRDAIEKLEEKSFLQERLSRRPERRSPKGENQD